MFRLQVIFLTKDLSVYCVKKDETMDLFTYTKEIFNPLTTNVPHHIETSQFICNANQLTGFYVMENNGPLPQVAGLLFWMIDPQKQSSGGIL